MQKYTDRLSCPAAPNKRSWFAIPILTALFFLLPAHATLAGWEQRTDITAQQMLTQPEKIPAWLKEGRIKANQIPDPHWKQDRCQACHSRKPTGKQLYLRNKDTNSLCNTCHSGEFDHSYIHPSEVRVKDAGMRKRMPKDFKDHLKAGRLSCATCHDITAQCLPNRRSEKRQNPRFFRHGPYKDRTALCYQCHDQTKYRRLNAHDQVTDQGEIKKHTCLLCHDKIKNLENADSIEEVGFHVKDNLVWVCGSCHQVLPHPSAGFSFTRKAKEPNHLTVPPDAIRQRMLQSEKTRGVILPLDPNTGKIFCATCHNPHEKGVIKNKAAAKGADGRKRLRTENICSNCHDI